MAEDGDGALAWAVLRRTAEYRDAWAGHAADSGATGAPEPGPFPIRVQTEADLDAARFELLAWEDPFAVEGPLTPFWRQRVMPEGVPDLSAPPLAGLAVEGGSVEGLRLLGGGLVRMVEHDGEAVQGRIGDGARFPDGAGMSVMHRFGLRMPHSMRRMVDFWNAAGRTAPRNGKGRWEGFASPAGC
ncbi:MAG: hypothetical protein F4Y57_02640 [Acidobacteria bacterium]|nr:hypothetical protein [Acidobacteriota bacterium]